MLIGIQTFAVTDINLVYECIMGLNLALSDFPGPDRSHSLNVLLLVRSPYRDYQTIENGCRWTRTPILQEKYTQNVTTLFVCFCYQYVSPKISALYQNMYKRVPNFLMFQWLYLYLPSRNNAWLPRQDKMCIVCQGSRSLTQEIFGFRKCN